MSNDSIITTDTIFPATDTLSVPAGDTVTASPQKEFHTEGLFFLRETAL